MEHYPLFIAGHWVDHPHRLEVLNKYSGRVLATVGAASRQEVEAAVTAALHSFHTRPLTPLQRYTILSRASQLISERAEGLALTIAQEAGKPLKDARGETNRAAQTFLIAAEEAKRIHGEMVPVEAAPGSENRLAFTLRVPLGVVCAISPFNFPLNLVAHKVAPALAAGNTVVLKPATATPISAVKLCRILEEAGLPPGHINLVVGRGDTVGEALLQDKRIAFYTFTGSPGVGLQIRNRIGLRKATLELGNNSATIIHEDAHLEKAAELCARMAFANAGQICISVQRLLVHKKVIEPFTRLLLEQVKGLVVGDPTDPATDVGPMISEAEAQRAMAWVEEAIQGGAKLLAGGRRQGALMEPTVLTLVEPTMKVACQEIFAPVVSLLPYATLGEAFRMVNDSQYGLQAGIFTNNLSVAMAAAKALEVGGVIVNDTSAYRADLMPYGGVKNSGIGREGPRYAIEEMSETRIVVLNL